MNTAERRCWLIDKSALMRLGTAPDGRDWILRIERGLVRVCGVTLLEIGVSARNEVDHRDIQRFGPVAGMPVEYLSPQVEDRAFEVQGLLAGRGQHRAPSLPDLLIAATAELRGLTVLHCDKDFDLIREVTGQPMQRLCD
ncbi:MULTISPECIES: PIN domain nuclease [unclassified Luteococcus]|uniref:PIN domain nuclease n=1 Tax=unclassified Luteococcus TaxID=2639923 RepID=UPI00313C426B